MTEDRDLIRAQARYVHSSARKARLVLEHIRGKSAVEAQSILAFQTRAVARDAGKVLRSAIANAENNNGHDAEDLVVVTAYADEGPTLKRWRARARGRVNRIRKRTCHITITVAPALPGEIKPRRERRARPATETPAVEPTPAAKPKRSRKKVAPAVDAESATEVEETEAAPEPEAVEPEVAPEAETAPGPEAAESAAESEAEPEAAEPETAAEPEAEPEVAEPEAAAEPEAEPEAAEPAGEETSSDTDETEKGADS